MSQLKSCLFKLLDIFFTILQILRLFSIFTSKYWVCLQFQYWQQKLSVDLTNFYCVSIFPILKSAISYQSLKNLLVGTLFDTTQTIYQGPKGSTTHSSDKKTKWWTVSRLLTRIWVIWALLSWSTEELHYFLMELFLKHFVTADKATDYLSQEEEEVVVMVMTLAVADLKLVELFAARQLSSKPLLRRPRAPVQLHENLQCAS